MSAFEQHDERDTYDGAEPSAKRVRVSGSWRPLNTPRGESALGGPIEPISFSATRTTQGNRRQSGVNGNQYAKYTNLISNAIRFAEPEGMATEEMIKWICNTQAQHGEGLDADKMEKGIRSALKQQLDRKKPKFWEYWDVGRYMKVWKMVDTAISPGGVQTPDHTPRSTGHLIGSPIGQHETQKQLPQTIANSNSNLRNSPDDYRRDQDEITVNNAPTMGPEREPLPDVEQPLSSRAEPNMPADAAIQASCTSPSSTSITHPQPSHQSEMASVSRDDRTRDSADSQAMSLQRNASKTPGGDIRAINRETRTESDEMDRLHELQRNNEERKRRKRKLEVDRSALPDIAVLRESAESAKARYAEQMRIAEEARKAADAADVQLKDGLAKEVQVADDEQKLAELIERSKVLWVQLRIDD